MVNNLTVENTKNGQLNFIIEIIHGQNQWIFDINNIIIKQISNLCKLTFTWLSNAYTCKLIG